MGNLRQHVLLSVGVRQTLDICHQAREHRDAGGPSHQVPYLADHEHSHAGGRAALHAVSPQWFVDSFVATELSNDCFVVGRLVYYTGYGNAAGFLQSIGCMAPPPLQHDSDSEDEYVSAINRIPINFVACFCFFVFRFHHLFSCVVSPFLKPSIPSLGASGQPPNLPWTPLSVRGS